VFDFVLNKESQFVLLQVKDYICHPLKRNAMQKTISVDIKEKVVGTDCEGIICKFTKQKQVAALSNILYKLGLLTKRWYKQGKNEIKQKLANQYMDDSITYW
jgi:hypothetical protein